MHMQSGHSVDSMWRPAKFLFGLAAAAVLVAGCAGTDPTESETTPGHASVGQVQVSEPHDGSPMGATGSSGEADASEQSSAATLPDAAPTAAVAEDGPEEESQEEQGAGDTEREGDRTLSQEMVPERPELPEPALSNEEIREIYGDERAPAAHVEGTFCNLRQSHLEQLSSRAISGGQVNDQMLRLALVSLGDDLAVWEGVVWQFPEVESEFESARAIYGHWYYAVALLDHGEADAAHQEFLAAQKVIDGWPEEAVNDGQC